MDNNVNFQINIGGNVFAGVGKLQGDFTQLVNIVGNVDKSVNNTFNNLKDKIQSINLNAVISQVQHVSQAIAGISAPGIGFEQGLADLSSITGTVGDDLVDLAKSARMIGHESGLGAAEAVKAYATIASQIEVDDIGLDGLKELQRNAVTLAHASGMSLEETANALSGTINQFGFGADQAGRVINVLAAGSKYGAAEINDLTESFKVVGSQSSIAGVSIEETAGALEVLSKNNIKGSEAGTHLRNIILSLQTVFGADLKNMSLSDALDQIKPKLNDAGFMAQNFGRMSMASAQFLVKYSEDIKDMTAKVTDTNTAQEQAAIRTDTVGMMMQRCRAKVDDLKIGFFEITGSFGGYATIVGEQAVVIAQLLPLLTLMGKGLQFVTSASKLAALWAGIVQVATVVWTGVQWAFNASLWACPLTWIVAAIIALAGVIVLCVTKVQGWGAQWKSITNFMKLSFELFVETVTFRWTAMANGIMLGLDYIKLGWYKFKDAVGLGDSDENQAMIAKINGDIEGRKQAIVDGARKIADLAVDAKNSLTWELSWRKGDKAGNEPESETQTSATTSETKAATTAPGSTQKLDLSGKSGRGRSGKKSNSILDLNKIIHNLKGSTAYSTIAEKLAPIKAASIAAAASLAMPVAIASTTLPQALDMPETRTATVLPVTSDRSIKDTDYPAGNRSGSRSVSMTKFCDTIQIHIANADNKGYEQIQNEVTRALKQVFDDYGA